MEKYHISKLLRRIAMIGGWSVIILWGHALLLETSFEAYSSKMRLLLTIGNSEARGVYLAIDRDAIYDKEILLGHGFKNLHFAIVNSNCMPNRLRIEQPVLEPESIRHDFEQEIMMKRRRDAVCFLPGVHVTEPSNLESRRIWIDHRTLSIAFLAVFLLSTKYSLRRGTILRWYRW